MSKVSDLKEGSGTESNRRVCTRRTLHALAYVDLGSANGGIVRDLSTGGLALTAASRLPDGEWPRMRVSLPGLQDSIEVQCHVAWLSESKREAGVAFEKLSPFELAKINQWISSEQESNGFVGVDQRTRSRASDCGRVDSSAINPVSPNSGAGKTAQIQAPTGGYFDGAPPVSAASPETQRSAAIIVLVALVSFSAGITVDGRIHQKNARVLEKSAGEAIRSANVPKDKHSHPPAVSAVAPSNQNRSATEVTSGTPAQNSVSTPSDAPSLSALQPVQADSEKLTVKQSSLSAIKTAEPYANESARSPKTTASLVAHADKRARTETRPAGAATNKQVRAQHRLERVLSASALHPITQPRTGSTPAEDRGSAPLEATQFSSTAMFRAGLPIVPSSLTKPPPPISGSITIRMLPFPYLRVPPGLKSRPSQAKSLQMGQLQSKVELTYPPEAIRERIEGTVSLHARIGPDGSIQNVTANGPPLLAEAARAAVQQWRYRPTLLGGRPMEADADIVMVFRLSAQPANTN